MITAPGWVLRRSNHQKPRSLKIARNLPIKQENLQTASTKISGTALGVKPTDIEVPSEIICTLQYRLENIRVPQSPNENARTFIPTTTFSISRIWSKIRNYTTSRLIDHPRSMT